MNHARFVDDLIDNLPGLRRYAIALVGNAVLADDLVQDTIERALRQSSQLRESKHLSGWLRRILHNLYIDEIRRRRVRGREQDITTLNNDLELSAAATDNSKIHEFVKAVNQLSVEHREILLLVGLQELNYREIAEELNIPVGTVMSRLARARERLRNLMQDDESVEIIPFARGRKGEP